MSEIPSEGEKSHEKNMSDEERERLKKEIASTLVLRLQRELLVVEEQLKEQLGGEFKLQSLAFNLERVDEIVKKILGAGSVENK